MSAAAWNTVFRALISVVKTGTDSKDIKNAIKAEYRIWNPASSAISEAFHAEFEGAYQAVLAGGAAAAPPDLKLLAGHTTTAVLASLADEADKAKAAAYVDALLALSIAAHATTDAAANAKALSRVQAALADPEAPLDDVILDDELAAFVRGAASKLSAAGVQLQDVPVAAAESSIMAIARDISAGVDPDMLSRPDGMQALVQSVSAGIGQRIQSGEVDPAALMQEATAMLQNIDIAQALKMIGGGQGGMDLGAMAGMMGGMDLSALAGMMGAPTPAPSPKAKGSKKK